MKLLSRRTTEMTAWASLMKILYSIQATLIPTTTTQLTTAITPTAAAAASTTTAVTTTPQHQVLQN